MIDMLAGSPFFGLFFVRGYSFLANHMLDRHDCGLYNSKRGCHKGSQVYLFLGGVSKW